MGNRLALACAKMVACVSAQFKVGVAFAIQPYYRVKDDYPYKVLLKYLRSIHQSSSSSSQTRLVQAIIPLKVRPIQLTHRHDSTERTLIHHGRSFRGSAAVWYYDGGMPSERLMRMSYCSLVVQMFAITGAGLSKIRHMQNGGKRARHSLDQWDRVSASSILFLIAAS